MSNRVKKDENENDDAEDEEPVAEVSEDDGESKLQIVGIVGL